MATSNPEWGERQSALAVAAHYAQRIRGRNVAITGIAPEGVGEGTALAFASQKPANLLLMSRTRSHLEAVANGIRNSYPDVNIHTILMDLSSQRSIHEASEEVKSLVSSLDLLVNNAACARRLRTFTDEGIEMQFGVNHIGHFLLTRLLFPLLKTAAMKSSPGAVRVINVSSHAHMLSPVRFHDYNMMNDTVLPVEEKPRPEMPPAFAKAQEHGYLSTIACKSANILFTASLQSLSHVSGVNSYAVHPGSVTSHLGREHDEDVAEAISKTSKYWKTVDEGGSTTLTACLDPILDRPCGLYLADCQFFQCADHAKNSGSADRLWKLSEKLTGMEFIIE
ncbi:NAD(P)-binding protein [Xylariaceae sp. FL0255]|nr:NAD(P)-binding protein [Xylariaceae sp. FL0255]